MRSIFFDSNTNKPPRISNILNLPGKHIEFMDSRLYPFRAKTLEGLRPLQFLGDVVLELLLELKVVIDLAGFAN